MLAWFWWTGRVWNEFLNGPIYVPEEGHYILSVLRKRGLPEFRKELQRLSLLRCTWATAIVAHERLRERAHNANGTQEAIHLCRSLESTSDPYILYILAWAELIADQKELAVKHMSLAAKKRFPPAALDLVSFAWMGLFGKELSVSAMLRLLGNATASHHCAAFRWRCVLYTSGQLGIVRAGVGQLLTPLAIARIWVALRINPFEPTSFRFDFRDTKPLFK